MTQRFVIRNQDGCYLSKSKEWVDGRDPVAVVNLPYYDQALNELIEANSKDIWIRGTILEVETNVKGRVQLEVIVPAVQEQLPIDDLASNDIEIDEELSDSNSCISSEVL